MPFNGSGTFQRSFPSGGWQGDATANIKIRADRHDQHDDDLAAGISNAICKDGQSSPTADIPFNGKKIVDLGAPINPTDATTKAYVDGRFGQIFTITGTDDAGRIVFAGSQSPLATGKPLGISFTQADLFFGVKPIDVETVGKVNRWVWNDKGDGTGTDVANMTEVGNFTVSGSITSNGYFLAPGVTAILATTGAGVVYLRPNGVASATGQATLDSAGTLTTTTMNSSTINSGTIGAAGNISANGNVTAAGSIGANGNVNAASSLAAVSGQMVIGPGGSGRIMQFSPQWYWNWNSANGILRYETPGGPWMQLDGNLTIYNQGYKPGGGSWAAGSDIRIKDVRGSYDAGLEEILQVNPVRYNYKATPDVEYIGVVAQEIEGIMPETVKLIEGEVDGETVTDLRTFDSTALIYALVNAVKTLSAKVEALEAQLAGAP